MRRNNCVGLSRPAKGRRVVKVLTEEPQGAANGGVATAKSRPASFSTRMVERLTIFARKPDGPKRQRTASASPSPSQEPQQFASQADSDDGTNGRATGAKKIRGAAARNHKEKELREERERSRQEAAKKRMGRAERRRVEGEFCDSGSRHQAKVYPQIQIHQRKRPYTQQNLRSSSPSRLLHSL